MKIPSTGFVFGQAAPDVRMHALACAGRAEPAGLVPFKTSGSDDFLEITDDAVDAIADVAVEVNDSVENIGARRLSTVVERVLDEISFEASDKPGQTVRIDAAYVRARVGDLAKNKDLSKFIL